MTNQEKKQWQDMADMTSPMCAGNGPGACKIPHSCCSPEYCHMAFKIAQKLGEELKPTNHATLPLMGPNGCTAPPHLRPLCSVHVCSINSFGFIPGEPKLTTKYFKLRDKLKVSDWPTTEINE